MNRDNKLIINNNVIIILCTLHLLHVMMPALIVKYKNKLKFCPQLSLSLDCKTAPQLVVCHGVCLSSSSPQAQASLHPLYPLRGDLYPPPHLLSQVPLGPVQHARLGVDQKVKVRVEGAPQSLDNHHGHHH